MDSSSFHPDFAALLGRLSDDRLDSDGVEQLGKLLEAEPELRRYFVEYCQMHALLRSEHGLLSAWSPAYATTSSVSARTTRWMTVNMARIAAVAALVLMAAGIPIVKYGRQDQPYRGAETAVLS